MLRHSKKDWIAVSRAVCCAEANLLRPENLRTEPMVTLSDGSLAVKVYRCKPDGSEGANIVTI